MNQPFRVNWGGEVLNLSFKLSGGMLFSQAGQESLLGNGHGLNQPFRVYLGGGEVFKQTLHIYWPNGCLIGGRNYVMNQPFRVSLNVSGGMLFSLQGQESILGKGYGLNQPFTVYGGGEVFKQPLHIYRPNGRLIGGRNYVMNQPFRVACLVPHVLNVAMLARFLCYHEKTFISTYCFFCLEGASRFRFFCTTNHVI